MKTFSPSNFESDSSTVIRFTANPLGLQEERLQFNLDSEPITIACPHCSIRFEETISRLKYEPKLFCPRCNRNVGVNLLELHTVLESVKKSSDDLLKKLVNRPDGKKRI